MKTNAERSDFVREYVQKDEFKKYPLTPDELETIANYILWGVDPQTGLNGRQAGDIELKTRYGTWDNQEQTSLDQLMMSETFNEGSVHEIGTVTPYKKIREVFDREKELARAGSIAPQLNQLFKTIDELDYQLESYELRHGRRTKPIRPELLESLQRFGSDLDKLEQITVHWGQYLYLKKKHELVELRREQYTLRDSYAPVQQSMLAPTPVVVFTKPDFGAGIGVLPLGLKYGEGASTFVFRDFEKLSPEGLGEDSLKEISKIYWEGKKDEELLRKRENKKKILDFRNGFQVQQIIGLIQELEKWKEHCDFESNIGAVVDTFWYYVKQADLNECLMDILMLKARGQKNQEIADVVNAKYGKSYTTNYISTIYCQRIIGKITEAATRHQHLIENIWYPEEWKRCTGCGRLLLKDSVNFTKKSRASDGFSSKCKVCEKIARDSK